MDIAERFIVTAFSNVIIFISFSQDLNRIDEIHNQIKERAIDDVSMKCIDLDNDNDNDFIFIYRCGESSCFDIYLSGSYGFKKIVDSEPGNVSYDFDNSVNSGLSNLIIESSHNHCCGESPFISFRQFCFIDDSLEIIENYVRFDYENYCFDANSWDYIFTPEQFLASPYIVIITNQDYNVRFSADLEDHKADFTCFDNSNIIGKLKLNSSVKVLAEKKGKDSSLRTWLYVEIDKSYLNFKYCEDPLTYDFKEQKLRGWISNKFTVKKE